MTRECTDARAKLTAYLDGELEGDRGSALRGHLRGCEACRQVAQDEASLRDGLRALPPIDPPATLWAGVQARLAAAEVADADRPAWRRAISRWLAPQQLWFAGAAIAALVGLVVWKSHREGIPVAVAPPPVVHENVVIAPSNNLPLPAPAPTPDVEASDVTAELAAAPARRTATYAATATELLTAAREARTAWSDDRKQTFDARITALQAAIDKATEDRARQTAYRAMIRYLERAATLDEVAVR